MNIVVELFGVDERLDICCSKEKSNNKNDHVRKERVRGTGMRLVSRPGNMSFTVYLSR